MSCAYIGLGGNLGQPLNTLRQAVERINEEAKASSFVLSSFYRTAPVDAGGPDYVNAVLKIETPLESFELLSALQKVENEFGRLRPAGVVNAPRTLDCDVLLFNDEAISEPRLTIPHPRMHQRAFVLVPLLEIAPEIIIPNKGKAKDFLNNVKDQRIEKIP